MNVERHSEVPVPFLKAKRLGGRIEFDSSHQSSLHFNMCSKVLRREEDSAMGRNEVLELDLGMRMTL